MKLKVGDKVKVNPSYFESDCWPADIKAGETGTSSRNGLVTFDRNVGGHGEGGRQWFISKKYLTLLKEKTMKPKDRMFTNSQKIRLRLKVFFDKNDTGYKDFEEFYTDFTDSMLDNLEFIVKSFKF